MTREEILDKIKVPGMVYFNFTKDEVLTAMSEFAQQEAIAFAEWKDEVCRMGRLNENYYMGQLMTYEQLYSLFKKQDNG